MAKMTSSFEVKHNGDEVEITLRRLNIDARKFKRGLALERRGLGDPDKPHHQLLAALQRTERELQQAM